MKSIIKEYLNIGNNLKKLRERYGENQTEFSKRLGISRSTYSNYENNNRIPDQDTIIRISNILEISVDSLIGADSAIASDDNPQSLNIKKKIRNEKFVDTETNKIINYRIIIHREDDPAIVHNKSGSFQIDLEIYNDREIRNFNLDFKYIVINHQIITGSVITKFSDDNNFQIGDYYDQYTTQINPRFPLDIQTSIENAIKIYFMELLRKPISINITHDF